MSVQATLAGGMLVVTELVVLELVEAGAVVVVLELVVLELVEAGAVVVVLELVVVKRRCAPVIYDKMSPGFQQTADFM